MLKATIPTALALAVALTLAGCGGGKPQDSTSTAAGAGAAAAPTMPADHPPAKASEAVAAGEIAKADGGLTVVEVYDQKASLPRQV